MSDVDSRPGGLREEPDNSGRPGLEFGSALFRLTAAVVLLGIVYVGVAFYFKDRPPVGVSVAGVDIGSMTVEEAKARLERATEPRLSEPVTITIPSDDSGETDDTDDSDAGGDDAAATADGTDAEQDPDAERIEVIPTEAGLGYDLDRTLDGVTGLSFDPRVLWSHVTGSPRNLRLVGSVDQAQLTQAIEGAAAEFDTEPVEGDVRLTDEGVEVVDAERGRELDVAQAVDAVADAWPEETTVEGRVTRLDPVLSDAEIDRFTGEVLEPTLAAPVTVSASWGEGDDEESVSAEIQPRELASMLTVERSEDQSELSLVVDDDALLARIREDLGQLERGPRDATVRLRSGNVEVVPPVTGAELETDGLVEAVKEAMAAAGDERAVEAQMLPIEPEITAEQADSWVFEEMGSFSSPYPTGPTNEARTANLQAGASNVNGTVVMPGQQFSLGSALGEISAAGGYVEAPIIRDGRLVMGMGGGLSQISTVVFNTSWFSGVQFDEHAPHSFYIARYPAGREATLSIPYLDNKWTNNTDNPIVVRSWTADDAVHMTYLGRQVYEVETIDGPRRDVQQPERSTDDSPDCVPQSPAEGFSITNIRILKQDGREVHRDELNTTYIPADEIVCTHRDAGR